MDFENFERIVRCFADQVDDLHVSGGELVLQIRDETITAKLQKRADGLFVEEDNDCMRAQLWIVKRLARLSLLADRICSFVSPPRPFVTPSGYLLDQPDRNPTGDGALQSNAVDAALETLGCRPAGTTSVLYLTSDAGEGKTSLIDYLAVTQAMRYKEKKADWLLLPVPMGGRAFLRFDDVVVAALVNRFRFQLLYYDAFLELVRLGVLVPAFDGFEEMIVETSSGEAISALGNLVGQLGSSGSLLVAARRAYFDYPSFKSQARLFDAIGNDNVAFGRLSLNRWDRQTFIRYASDAGLERPSDLYDKVSGRLNKDHPLLTRAVLVKRLVDVARGEESDLSDLLARISRREQRDYFHEFVNGLVDREARFKWRDRSGSSQGSLLTVGEHHELLALVAQEMWIGATDELGTDVVAILVDMFAETADKSPSIARQIKARLEDHALLVKKSGKVAFDHEDFRTFYLGQALGRMLVRKDIGDVRSFIDKAALPEPAVAEAVRYVRNEERILGALALLQGLADHELPASFVRENCGALTLGLVDGGDGRYEAKNMSFPAGSLRGRRFSGLRVSDAYFHASSVTDTTFRRCRFVNCHFERLDVDGTITVSESMFNSCRVDSLVRVYGDKQDDQVTIFAPDRITRELHQMGFETESGSAAFVKPTERGHDDDLRLAQRFLRAFLRSTELNHSTIKMRLGTKASHFFGHLLPELRQAGVVTQVSYQGHGNQGRVKLAVPMAKIEEAMSAAHGEFSRFVGAFTGEGGARKRQ